MPNRGKFTSVFFFFLLLSFFIYVVFQTGIGKNTAGVLELAVRPIQHGIFSVYAATKGKPSRVQQLQDEINSLQADLIKAREQEKEIQALRDQFAQTNPSTRSLLAVNIIGLKGFIPGYTQPEELVIDKGKNDGVVLGQPVVSGAYLIGTVTKVENHVAVVDLTYKKNYSMTAVTQQTNALGVAKGMGEGEIYLDNVLLSENLKKDDFVITKGSVKENGTGTPPGLIIGKIASVDKKPSSLFQTAKMNRPVDLTKLTSIFVVLPTN